MHLLSPEDEEEDEEDEENDVDFWAERRKNGIPPLRLFSE